MTAVAAESMPPTPPPVAETFVRVLVGFGVVWAAIWRLPAMVEVVDVSIVGLKMARKEALSQKKRNSAPMPFRKDMDLGGTEDFFWWYFFFQN